MSTQLKQTLSTFMERVWNSGDLSQLADLIAPTYTVTHDPGDPWDGQTLSRDQFRTRVMYSRNAFPDLRFDIQQMIAEEDKVVAQWVMSGTHQGDLPQLPATGRPFAISGMTIYAFEDGKITGHIQSFDRLGFLGQIGFLG